MKHVLKIALVGLLLAGLIMGIAACGGGGDGGGSGSIVGTWTVTQTPDGTGVGAQFAFNADGTGVIIFVPMTYVYTGSTVTMTAMGDSETYSVTWLSDNIMRLTSLEDGDWAVLARN